MKDDPPGLARYEREEAEAVRQAEMEAAAEDEVLREDPEHGDPQRQGSDDGSGPCDSCAEGMPVGECPSSKRPCGHHSNESWEQDECFWCGEVWGE